MASKVSGWRRRTSDEGVRPIVIGRRAFLGAGTGGGVFLAVQAASLRSARADGLRLSAFIPTNMGVLAFQRLLAESMPSINVVALGRYRDFEDSLGEGPDA